MSRWLAFVLATLALPFVMATAASAHFNVCNDTKAAASVAVGFYNDEDGWTAAGWWNVEKGECLITVEDPLVGDYVYVLVHGDLGSWSALPNQTAGYFCVSDESFVSYNADYEDDDGVLDCGDELDPVQFRELSIEGRKNVTLRLNF